MFLDTQRQPHLETSDDSLHYYHTSSNNLSLKMATEFAMPAPAQTYNTNTSPSQYTLYNTHSQQVSPIGSVNTTPNNISPTSPRSHLPLQTRQLRPPKSPLYVPAVLRPTDPPARRMTKPSPLTPPHSLSNSFDSLNGDKPLSRRTTADSGKFGLGVVTENEWAPEYLGQVTALPSRKHWKVC